MQLFELLYILGGDRALAIKCRRIVYLGLMNFVMWVNERFLSEGKEAERCTNTPALTNGEGASGPYEF